MSPEERFAEAMRRIDAANAEDPRSDGVAGLREPRELRFARCVSAWVEQLVEQPSEALRLAARGHTLRRWTIPRDRYPMDTAGYHGWRGALARYHADETSRILREVGYDDALVQRVAALIRRELFPQDADARALEDADCLAFLELKFHRYRDAWDEGKTLRILRGTLGKMTPAAREIAGRLDLDAPERELLRRALATE